MGIDACDGGHRKTAVVAFCAATMMEAYTGGGKSGTLGSQLWKTADTMADKNGPRHTVFWVKENSAYKEEKRTGSKSGSDAAPRYSTPAVALVSLGCRCACSMPGQCYSRVAHAWLVPAGTRQATSM